MTFFTATTIRKQVFVCSPRKLFGKKIQIVYVSNLEYELIHFAMQARHFDVVLNDQSSNQICVCMCAK